MVMGTRTKLEDVIVPENGDLGDVAVGSPSVADFRNRSKYDSTMKKVLNICLEENVFEPGEIRKEVEHFFTGLGMHPFYFESQDPETIATHILGIKAAQVQAKMAGKDAFEVAVAQESEDSALFAVRSNVFRTGESKETLRPKPQRDARGMSTLESIERKIEEEYLNSGTECIVEQFFGQTAMLDPRSPRPTTAGREKKMFRLQCYRSEGLLLNSKYHLRLYFLSRPVFKKQLDQDEMDNEDPVLENVADKHFLERAGPNVKRVYSEVVKQAKQKLTPAINVETWKEQGRWEARLTVAIQVATTHSYFAGIADVYRAHALYSSRKYVEFFANGVVVYGFYLCGLQDDTDEDFHNRVKHVVYDVSLHFALPRTSLTPLLKSHQLNPQQVAYAYAIWKFAFHFLQRVPDGYKLIADSLAQSPEAYSGLQRLRKSMMVNTFTESQILEMLFNHCEVIRIMYQDFYNLHNAVMKDKEKQESKESLLLKLKKMAKSEAEMQVFESFVRFNRSIRRTNFFKKDNLALAFRLDGSVLSEQEYPQLPYGIVYIVGSEFRGFHFRFEDIARGGIRMIRSSHGQVFNQNLSTLIEENYNLAFTQQKKNKDIPEGGSKGTILLNLAHQDKAEVAFKKYIGSMLDLMLPTDDMVDYLGKEELLFLGPDEGTAHLMDWASQYARKRGYRYWKSFTTGKSASRGGIPHDVYGMTTHSVRQYVLGIQEKCGLTGRRITKVQTGGPDGDLGSNEIKMANEDTIAVVDGSGVLYDPAGIDQKELLRLANDRKMVSNVNKKKISSQGYLILTSEDNVTLPNGEVVENGTMFRNYFHLNPQVSADFFVPCGGRPESVNINNYKQFAFKEDGVTLRFKYIVEGANLFFTQDARLALESLGVILFKDSSANKGGVTSSSLEVLTALALTDEEFAKNMQVGEGSALPEFYQTYVKEVQDRIDRNAALEFECIWAAHKVTKKPISTLSNELSGKIVELKSKIATSSLWDQEKLVRKILSDALPQTLLTLLGLDECLARLPEQYQRALFASQLASNFVYKTGLMTTDFSFYEFVQGYLGKRKLEE